MYASLAMRKLYSFTRKFGHVVLYNGLARPDDEDTKQDIAPIN